MEDESRMKQFYMFLNFNDFMDGPEHFSDIIGCKSDTSHGVQN